MDGRVFSLFRIPIKLLLLSKYQNWITLGALRIIDELEKFRRSLDRPSGNKIKLSIMLLKFSHSIMVSISHDEWGFSVVLAFSLKLKISTNLQLSFRASFSDLTFEVGSWIIFWTIQFDLLRRLMRKLNLEFFVKCRIFFVAPKFLFLILGTSLLFFCSRSLVNICFYFSDWICLIYDEWLNSKRKWSDQLG